MTRKKLIEVALPLEAINETSAREKSIRYGHPSTIHIWWARRPLAACRAVIFASLVDDPDDPDAPLAFVEACGRLPRGKNAAENDTPRQRLFDFIETLVKWESTTDEKVLATARELIRLATEGRSLPLLDPFAGGGSIPLEAQRLGLQAHAGDLNPVAVMINKALLEIPPRFANIPPVNPRDRKGQMSDTWHGAQGLAADVRYYGERMRERAWERIGHLYPQGPNGETVMAWIWTRTVRSPNPAVDADVPLVGSFWLSKNAGRKAWIEPIPNPGLGSYHFEVRTGTPKNTTAISKGLKAGRATFRCLLTNVPITSDYVRAEGLADRLGFRLMAMVLEASKGRKYSSPTEEHELIAKSAVPNWKPEAELAYNPRHMSPPLYGMARYSDLFTPRQLAALTTFADLVKEVAATIYEDAINAGLLDDGIPLSDGGSGASAYAEAVSVYLAFCVDKLADRNSVLTPWASNREHPRNTFARQALSMSWDFAESNPFSDSSGNFLGGVDVICRILDRTHAETAGVAKQLDAATISLSGDTSNWIISTDPPYYDNVPYADLSDYFYIWLRHTIRDIYPEVFGTLLVPKSQEIVADSQRHNGDKEAANRHFEEKLNHAFLTMRQMVCDEYPLTVYYAFKQTEISVDSGSEEAISSTGWETMLSGLISAGFMINGTWPVRTELARRARNLGANALASSIVLVCRPRPENAPMTSRREFVNILRKELPVALHEMQSGNIAPVDLAQASIGPGMAVYSRYSKVLEPNGDQLTVRTALQLINHELDAYLAAQEGHIDADSRFAVAWFEQFGFKEGPFGQADVLARAKNTSVDGLAYAGILESGGGKVRLYHWSELDPGWDPATDKRLAAWEATHHLIERLNTYGEEGAARLLAKMPSDLATEARQLAYRLYSICDRKGWAEQARDYNALVISWGASQEQAREFKEQYQQGRLF